jgi:hypothetical protein
MISRDESDREHGIEWQRAERTRSSAKDVSAWGVNSWVGDFALNSRLPGQDSNFRPNS